MLQRIEFSHYIYIYKCTDTYIYAYMQYAECFSELSSATAVAMGRLNKLNIDSNFIMCVPFSCVMHMYLYTVYAKSRYYINISHNRFGFFHEEELLTLILHVYVCVYVYVYVHAEELLTLILYVYVCVYVYVYAEELLTLILYAYLNIFWLWNSAMTMDFLTKLRIVNVFMRMSYSLVLYVCLYVDHVHVCLCMLEAD